MLHSAGKAIGFSLQREAGRRILLALAGVLVLGTFLGCNDDAIRTARDRGAVAGFQDGQNAGDAEGYASGYKAEVKSAYRDTLDSLYATGKFHRRPFYSTLVITIALLLGFGAQFLTLFLLRANGVPDIDRIVLPKHLTEVSFADIGKEPSESSTISISCWLLFLLIPLLSTVSCDSAKDAYEVAYKANYAKGYQDGFQVGDLRGRTAGRENGIAAAQKAADSGEAWQLYVILATWSLGIGVFLGLAAQYMILFECRKTGRLRQLPILLFVPAIRRSLAYSVFDNYRRLRVETDAALLRLGTDRKLKEARAKAVMDDYLLKAKALGSIEQFSQARLVEMAEVELSRIVSASEEKARSHT